MDFKIVGKKPLVSIFYGNHRVTQVGTRRFAKQLICDYRENTLGIHWIDSFNDVVNNHQVATEIVSHGKRGNALQKLPPSVDWSEASPDEAKLSGKGVKE